MKEAKGIIKFGFNISSWILIFSRHFKAFSFVHSQEYNLRMKIELKVYVLP